MNRERELSDVEELDVLDLLANDTSADSISCNPESTFLLTAELLSDCGGALLARTAAISDVASASLSQSSDASEAVPNIRDAEQCGPNTNVSISGEDTLSSFLYKLPNGSTVNLKGWRQEMRGGAAVIISPQGDEYSSMHYAYEALYYAWSHGHGRSCALKVMNRSLTKFMERHSS
jgi:hypothetical protein